jgi:hypothetical protein
MSFVHEALNSVSQHENPDLLVEHADRVCQTWWEMLDGIERCLQRW